MYSPADVHAVYSSQTVKFCKRLLCALAKTSPDDFLFLQDFSSVEISQKMWTTLAQLFSAKTKSKKIRGSNLGMGM